jgi:CheB methylesterase
MVAQAIVAVGAAGGGIEPLRRITERLSRNCGATVFVVMHSGAASFLPEILSWHGKLPVEFAREGAPIEAGRIYVASRTISGSIKRPGSITCVQRSIPCSPPSPRPTTSESWVSFSAEPVKTVRPGSWKSKDWAAVLSSRIPGRPHRRPCRRRPSRPTPPSVCLSKTLPFG